MAFKQNHTVRQILDSLEANVCLLDKEGNIEEINNTWLKFARENGAQMKDIGKNVNYLAVCEQVDKKDKDAELAKKFADGIRAVINGQKLSFEMEYPCHSPDKQRWFRGLVTPSIESKPGQRRKVIIFHEEITEKKLAEKKQVSLRELCETFPVKQGLPEILTYMLIASRRERKLIDTEKKQEIIYSENNTTKRISLPLVIFIE